MPHDMSHSGRGRAPPAVHVVDRFLIKEGLAGGQRILAFRIFVDAVEVYNGTAVGSAHIALLGRNVSVAAGSVAELRIDATQHGAPATVTLFAVPNPVDCVLPAAPGGCKLMQVNECKRATARGGGGGGGGHCNVPMLAGGGVIYHFWACALAFVK